MSRILGIVPARAGSKRLPRKNLLPLGGKPLVERVIEASLEARLLDRIVVSSDDPEVLELARRIDASLPLRRPPELASDASPAIDYVRHALKASEEANEEDKVEVVVIVQPSSPLTLPDDIDRTVELLLRTGADSAVSVMKLDHALNPLKLKVMKGDRLLPYLEDEAGRMASHELPEVYIRNGAVYATRRETINGGLIIGADCRGYVMPRERSVDINEWLDYQFVCFLVQQDARGRF
jgi:CMP-N,N'-diacetyllegionaminic acid synthase